MYCKKYKVQIFYSDSLLHAPDGYTIEDLAFTYDEDRNFPLPELDPVKPILKTSCEKDPNLRYFLNLFLNLLRSGSKRKVLLKVHQISLIKIYFLL